MDVRYLLSSPDLFLREGKASLNQQLFLQGVLTLKFMSVKNGQFKFIAGHILWTLNKQP